LEVPVGETRIATVEQDMRGVPRAFGGVRIGGTWRALDPIRLRCGCGRAYTLAEFRALPGAGVWRLGGFSGEQRRCACGSHRTVRLCLGLVDAMWAAAKLVRKAVRT
jgi:hypothetical protein